MLRHFVFLGLCCCKHKGDSLSFKSLKHFPKQQKNPFLFYFFTLSVVQLYLGKNCGGEYLKSRADVTTPHHLSRWDKNHDLPVIFLIQHQLKELQLCKIKTLWMLLEMFIFFHHSHIVFPADLPTHSSGVKAELTQADLQTTKPHVPRCKCATAPVLVGKLVSVLSHNDVFQWKASYGCWDWPF